MGKFWLFSVILVTTCLQGCLKEDIHTVEYWVVTNCDTVTVTYDADGDGDITQSTVPNGLTPPWTYSFDVEFDGDKELYISAQSNCGSDYSEKHKVIVKIFIDGVEEERNECEGEYCVATLSEKR